MQLSAGAVGRGDSPGGSNRRRADGLKGAGSAPSAGGRRGEGGALAQPRAAIFSDRSPRAARSHSPFCPATPSSRSSSLTTPRVPPRPLTVLAARHARVLVRLPPTDPSVRSSSVSLCSAFRHTQS